MKHELLLLRHNPPPRQAFDFIGDIHGQHGKLLQLLDRLGYEERDDIHRHPEGRIPVFLGDLLDRGPDVRGLVRRVRNMVEAHAAFCILGNHEYNFILLHTPDRQGGWLRPRTEENLRQCEATHLAFIGYEEELTGHLHWMKGLPLALDLGGCRAVHACWDDAQLKRVAHHTLHDPEFLLACGNRTTEVHAAMELLAKGPELTLPEDLAFLDKKGIERRNMRTRWWNLEGLTHLADLAMPPGTLVGDMPLQEEHLRPLPNYPADAPPVFFGHYWMPPAGPKAPLANNLACLDYGAGLDGPLTAYRWNGETTLNAANFVQTDYPALARAAA